MTLHDFDVLISVDIGLTGGIAFFDIVSGGVLALYSMPTNKIVTSSGRNKGELDIPKLKFILEIPHVKSETALVVMESVHAFPGQGVVAMATLMEQKGIIRGLCSGLGYDEELVEPKTWQKYYGMIPPKDLKGPTASKTKTLRKAWLKAKSLEIARDKFQEWANTKLAPKDAHGLSDALLIGNWYLSVYPEKKCDFDPTAPPYDTAPIGMFHCPKCGEMVLANVPHL